MNTRRAAHSWPSLVQGTRRMVKAEPFGRPERHGAALTIRHPALRCLERAQRCLGHHRRAIGASLDAGDTPSRRQSYTCATKAAGDLAQLSTSHQLSTEVGQAHRRGFVIGPPGSWPALS